MLRTLGRLDAWLVIAGSVSLLAWVALALDGSGLTLPAFCSPGRQWAAPLLVSFDLAISFNAPARLAACSVLMVAAMMSPLIIAPLRYVRDRSFARRRTQSMLLFAAGYVAMWMIAIVALQAVVLTLRWAMPAPLPCLSLSALVLTVWQVSPAKQRLLNRCHRRPSLAAFGSAADCDVLRFGVAHGVFCVGACWALMLLALLAPRAHVLAMIAVTLFVVAERLEGPFAPAWRWRGGGKALRIINAQAHMRLAQLLELVRLLFTEEVAEHAQVTKQYFPNPR